MSSKKQNAQVLVVGFMAMLCVSGCNAQKQSGTTQKEQALQSLRDTGVISEQEYQQRLSQLGSSGGAAQTGDPNLRPSVPHVIPDPQYGQPYGTVTLPVGWAFNGGVIHADTCAVTGPSAVFAAQSPDGLFGVINMPQLRSNWSNAPQLVNQLRQMGCNPAQVMTPSQFVQAVVLPRLQLQNARIDTVRPSTMLSGLTHQLRQQQQQVLAAMGGDNTQYQRNTHNVDSAEMRLSFQANGRDMTATIGALTVCNSSTTIMPVTGERLDSNDCTAPVLMIAYAPSDKIGMLERVEYMKVQPNPSWQQHNAEILAQQGQQIAANGNATLNATARLNHERQDAIFKNWQLSSKAQRDSYDRLNSSMKQNSDKVHESNAAFVAHMGDYNDFADPSTGKTVRASNQYSNTYMNDKGTVMLQTDQAGSPGVDWSLMVPRFK